MTICLNGRPCFSMIAEEIFSNQAGMSSCAPSSSGSMPLISSIIMEISFCLRCSLGVFKKTSTAFCVHFESAGSFRLYRTLDILIRLRSNHSSSHSQSLRRAVTSGGSHDAELSRFRAFELTTLQSDSNRASLASGDMRSHKLIMKSGSLPMRLCIREAFETRRSVKPGGSRLWLDTHLSNSCRSPILKQL